MSLRTITYGSGLPRDYIRRGPIFRALRRNTRGDNHCVQSSVLLCFPIVMEVRYAKRDFCTLVANLGAFCAQYPDLYPRLSVLTDNLVDDTGQAVNNDMRNKVMVRVDLDPVPFAMVVETKSNAFVK